MIFSTQVFLFLFLPPVLLVSLFLKKEAQNVFLLLASLFFYAWGEGALVFLLLASALLNHRLGLAIAGAALRHMRSRTPTTTYFSQAGVAVFLASDGPEGGPVRIDDDHQCAAMDLCFCRG